MSRRCLLLLLVSAFLSAGWSGCAAHRPVVRAGVVETREQYTSGGRTIRVETFAPAGAGRHPAVLVLHSSAGVVVGKKELREFSRQLAQRGKVAFFVRYFDRTGTTIASEREIDELSAVWLETVRDAVSFASRHPRVRADRIGLFGYSLGAYLAVAESSLDPRVDAVAEIAGGVFENFEPRMRRLPPILIVHGGQDERVPLSEAYEIRRNARRFGAPFEFQIYDGEGHLLSREAMTDAGRRALDFLDQRL